MEAPAIPVTPPDAWFDDPCLPGPTPLTVTREGHVLGHVAAWNTRHVGLPGHVTPPSSASGYRYYLSGQVETETGRLVSTGRITLGTGHADLAGNLTAASEHYDNTGSAVADVVCGEDAHGIWFAGALRPDVTPSQVRTLRASSLSGDWRPVGRGGLELVGVLAVNVPGFPTPRQAVTAAGDVAAVVAAGVVPRELDAGDRARRAAAVLASIDYADVFALVAADARVRRAAALLASIHAAPSRRLRAARPVGPE
ncbi:hypothetical protein [Actinomycetospora flava]|uniref:Capsid decoration protein n=1 Tax=Actinomycetospora flava TaxID=3129232 RepID=A0ABU8M0G5_9PSEU